MAISHGHLKFTGRIGDVIYYYVGNEIYVRTVFANQRKRVMKDERYELFRLYGSFFSQSSKIGSFIYRALGLKNEKKFYNKMVGEAQKFFRHTGMNGEQVLEVMVEKYIHGFEVEVPVENEVSGTTYNKLVKAREARLQPVVEAVCEVEAVAELAGQDQVVNKDVVVSETLFVTGRGDMLERKEEAVNGMMNELQGVAVLNYRGKRSRIMRLERLRGRRQGRRRVCEGV